MFNASMFFGMELRTGTNRFSSPRTTAVFCMDVFFFCKRFSKVPMYLACPIFFGIPNAEIFLGFE